MSTRFSLSMEMSRLTWNGTAEPVSRDQILRHARGQGNIHFPCSADHEQDWQPYPVDPYSAKCVTIHTYIHTHNKSSKYILFIICNPFCFSEDIKITHFSLLPALIFIICNRRLNVTVDSTPTKFVKPSTNERTSLAGAVFFFNDFIVHSKI